MVACLTSCVAMPAVSVCLSVRRHPVKHYFIFVFLFDVWPVEALGCRVCEALLPIGTTMCGRTLLFLR